MWSATPGRSEASRREASDDGWTVHAACVPLRPALRGRPHRGGRCACTATTAFPSAPDRAALAPAPVAEGTVCERACADSLVRVAGRRSCRYSFVDPRVASAAVRRTERRSRSTIPIAANLAVMRTTLWGGLICAWRYNTQRQQKRVRLFELGAAFHRSGGRHRRKRHAWPGSRLGARAPEQWGAQARTTDFFDREGGSCRRCSALRAGVRAAAAHCPPCIRGRRPRSCVTGSTPSAGSARCIPRWCAPWICRRPPCCSSSTGHVAADRRSAAPGDFRIPAARRDLALSCPKASRQAAMRSC